MSLPTDSAREKNGHQQSNANSMPHLPGGLPGGISSARRSTEHVADTSSETQYRYFHGSGEHLPVRYKPTCSWSCLCHHATDCFALLLIAAFFGFAGWICYYALNNGGG